VYGEHEVVRAGIRAGEEVHRSDGGLASRIQDVVPALHGQQRRDQNLGGSVAEGVNIAAAQYTRAVVVTVDPDRCDVDVRVVGNQPENLAPPPPNGVQGVRDQCGFLVAAD
jgi:hypothetical protein